VRSRDQREGRDIKQRQRAVIFLYKTQIWLFAMLFRHLYALRVFANVHIYTFYIGIFYTVHAAQRCKSPMLTARRGITLFCFFDNISKLHNMAVVNMQTTIPPDDN